MGGEAGAGRIDRSRVAGGARADDDDIVDGGALGDLGRGDRGVDGSGGLGRFGRYEARNRHERHVPSLGGYWTVSSEIHAQLRPSWPLGMERNCSAIESVSTGWGSVIVVVGDNEDVASSVPHAAWSDR